MNRIFSLIILIALSTGISWSQDQDAIKTQETQETEEIKDLSNQYQFLKQSAETYGDYKVFKVSKLDDFWNAAVDSIAELKQKIDQDQVVINEQLSEIETLVAQSKSSEEKFQENEFAATHINFLGIDFGKSTFTIIMSSLVIGLILVVAIGYAQFKRSVNIATQSSAECLKIETELEELRKKSLEKQVRLNRDLQTQRNIVEDLRSKGTITKKISA